MNINEEFNFNQKTGLTKDVLNPLDAKITNLSNPHPSDKRKESIKEDLPSYEEYFRKKCPEEFDEIIKKANPEYLNKYNSTIREYNEVQESMRLDIELNRDYLASLQNIIFGL